MAVTIDASSPATSTATANTTATLVVGPFTPPANTLLVAVGVVGYSGTSTDATFNVSDSLSGTWQTDAVEWPGSGGLPQVLIVSRWNTPSSSMTVTLNTGTLTKGKQLTVYVLNGAATSSWLGGNAVSTTTMDGSVTTATVGAMVFAGSCYDASSGSIVADGNTTTTNHLTDSSDGLELFTGRSTNTVSSPGATTYGWTGAGATAKSWAGAEYKPASGSLPRSLFVPPQAVIRSYVR